MALGKNQFSDAQQLFKEAVQKDPTNAVVSRFIVVKFIICRLAVNTVQTALPKWISQDFNFLGCN